jgi:hypothetical protein
MAESTDRRRFLSRCAATLAASLAGKSVGFAESHSYSGRSAGKVRSAVRVRTRAALQDEDLRVVRNTGNSDEMLYPFKIGSYHKGLPHNDFGEVDTHAYGSLVKSLLTGYHKDFENIALGGNIPLVNPQAATPLGPP